MAHQWRGVMAEYRDRMALPVDTPIVTLGEGGTPLVRSASLSAHTNCEVYLKCEGVNPTGSFKDRGMTAAMSLAVYGKASAVICASTGNTSASAAAYATAAGLPCAVLVPDGKIAMGKLSQAIAHGASILQVEGNFDDCLRLARELCDQHGVELVNSVNPARIQGQKTAAFEVVDALGSPPDIHCLPVGNAGNVTAYWLGYTEYSQPYAAADGSQLPAVTGERPQMWGFQAAGAAPIVRGAPVAHPETIASAIRIGNPASWQQAMVARDESDGVIEAVPDDQILSAHRWISSRDGVFVEPASAASVAGLLQRHAAGQLTPGKRVVCTVTGHGLKDPDWGMRNADGDMVQPVQTAANLKAVAQILGLGS